MMLLTAVLVAGGIVLGLIVVARYRLAIAWRASLQAFRLTLPANLTVDDIAAWLSGVAASTHAPRLALLPYPPVAIEVVATHRGISHYLLVPEKMRATVLSGLRASLAGARLEEAPDYLTGRSVCQFAAEAVLTSRTRPLAADRAETTSRAILAALQPLGEGQQVVLQWILTSAGTPSPVRQRRLKLPPSKPNWLPDVEPVKDADDIRAERLKQRDPLLHSTLRVGVKADTEQVYGLYGRVWGVLRGQNATGVLLVRRVWLWPRWASKRLHSLAVPITRWPILINARELVGLIGFPIGSVYLPGLPRAVARQLPPPVNMPVRGAVVALSTYTGMTDRALALHVSDRLRHMWCIGPTGVGKSTLLANMIIQDIQAGRSVVLLDPKGDLVGDVLDRVPDDRRDDIVVVSPSETGCPIGLNVLNTGHGEHARELAVDALVHLMASLWRSSFGPRTSDVLRNALLTLTHTTAVDGSTNTLLELPEVLLNPQFRGFVLAQPGVPESVRPFWASYEQLKDGAREQVIGPTLNKLRSFTTRTALRLMLGQSSGVRLDELFTKRRVFMFNLAKGVLGTDTTALIGSLVMAGLWQATLERVTVSHEKRHPVFMYLDEFQDFLRLPVALADMLAQARGLGVGLVLAHQYLGQLTDDVKTAVLGTARTQVSFQVEFDDATALASRFAPLTREDLSGLAAFEIAMRPCVDAATLSPVTGRTQPLPSPVTDGQALARTSQERFGVPRSDVEAMIRARIDPPATRRTRIGRSHLEVVE